jgi:hypothetical protein
MQMRKQLRYLITLVLIAVIGAWAQGREYAGPDDPAGDKSAEREGGMSGNNIYLYYQNTTELANWVSGSSVNYSEWPVGPDAVRMLDGIALLVSSMVILDKNTGLPLENPPEFAPPQSYDTLFYLQTSYREEMDRDPSGQVEWGFYPVFGYFNPAAENPAISNNDFTWPLGGWPAPNGQTKWPGEWNGRFGRGVIYADLETFFVVNDAQDLEYLGVEDAIRYEPRPGVKIGDKNPDVSIQYGQPWGGIGIRVEQRGFQWNNPQTRDAIFWEYSIANISDYTLPNMAFGYWVDNGIGAGADDDFGYFDRQIDMAYSWDIDGVGAGGVPTGTMGFAYLESPGLPFDGIDNDNDGLTDEKRDNDAQMIIGPTDGITDLQAFLDFYNLNEADLVDHWDADEDQDWNDGIDLNGNGRYYAIDTIFVNGVPQYLYRLEEGEDAGDDVGLDGVGPADLNYSGPDADGSECNHRPDYIQGVGSEPDFNATDVSESDMVGLTAFQMFPVPSHSLSYRWFRGDRSMWELLGSDTLVEFLGNISNLIETFASGVFPLYQGTEERISMSELHSYDPLVGLNSEEHSAPKLYLRKQIVQVVYESDYRFARPPLLPTLSATTGDGFVILTWDDVADQKTREPLLNNANDFEGYKLFRSTDADFSDPRIITDGSGDPVEMKPLFECDLIDGIQNYANWGTVVGEGYAFFLGNETGLTHYYIDTTVTNGRTYYYGLSAYDYGIEESDIAPSYNPVAIQFDRTTDQIIFIPQNVKIATPHQDAAGYVPPEVELDFGDPFGSGDALPEIVAAGAVSANTPYVATFGVNVYDRLSEDDDQGVLYRNNHLEIKNMTTGELVYREDSSKFANNNMIYDEENELWAFQTTNTLNTDIFAGLRLAFRINSYESAYSYANSGWANSDLSIPMRVVPTIRESDYLAWKYRIEFTDNPAIYTTRVTSTRRIRDEFDNRDPDGLLLGQSFNFFVVNEVLTDASGEALVMDIVAQDLDGDGAYDPLTDRVLIGALDSDGDWVGTAFVFDLNLVSGSGELPPPGAIYNATFTRSFWRSDSLKFTIRESNTVDAIALDETMDMIQVVPNPYIGTNGLEPAVKNRLLSQQRRIMFTHIPAQCDIKIFTASGIHVKTIEVRNPAEDGKAYWNLVSKENLAVAAGIYIYHVEAMATGKTKMGKFAIIK